MLLKNAEISIYKLDNNGNFDALGQINKFTSLIWPDKYRGHTYFELNVPVTPENRSLIKKGNIIWCGKDNAAIIEIIKSDMDENGQKTLNVKGRTLEVLLSSRIIWGTYTCVGKASSTAMYEIVEKQCVNPKDLYRKIPFLECAVDEKFGKQVSFQKTGGEVYEALESIATEADLGFEMLFKPKEKKIIFKVIEGIDRSEGINPVIFSTDLNDILSSSYYTNDQDVKTLAYVAGEGSGAERKHIISGNNASIGFERKELYVDARDLQSEVTDADGNKETISEEDYRDLLNDRGIEKLAEHEIIETFEAKIRVIGNDRYVYGIDYYKGDKIIMQDTDIGVQIKARITEVSENYDDEYELILTFGYELPTLIQKIKRQMLK